VLRVGLVCPYSLSVPGGVQAQVLGLARTLRSQGVETRVLAPCDGPPPELFVTPLGNSIPTAANGSVAPVAPDPACTLRTFRALADERFDVLHLHEPLAPGCTMAALIMHSSPILATFHAAGDSASYRYMGPVLRWVSERMDLRVAVSDDAAELATRYLPADYEVLFNGVELEQYQRPPSVPTQGPTIFFLGRHEPRKGLDVLLDAMRTLGPEVRCWVASDGPDTARLRQEHAGDPRIEWLGRISDHEKVARLTSADVFCAPSLGGESFGVVLIEAMAADTTVVASALPGYRNVATPDVDALMVPPGDPEALAGALRRALGDHELARRLREGGRRRAQDFSMGTLAALYLERYEKLVAHVPPEELTRGALGQRLLRRMMLPS
jgi:phosphatidylinositol alpha-mannosyltransferase